MGSAMTSIDINSDMGEAFGAWRMGEDETLLGIVSSANVACGFHGGDPNVMFETFRLARARGVAVGAHPGFQDLVGFGRRRIPHSSAEIERLVAYQVGAAAGMSALAGHPITYVKAHGALGNLASEEIEVGRAVARGVKAVDRTLVSLAIAATESERGAKSEGLEVASELFADRAYRDDGRLVARGEPGAVIHDTAEVGRRVVAMVEAGGLITISGKLIPTPIHSICIHSDTPGAVAVATAVRTALAGRGIEVRAFAPARVSAR